MKIILEGADGTGKTTLAKILAEKYGLDICHCTQHDPGDYDFYFHTLRKENVVWDRHALGELIYPRIFDRRPCISPEDARLLMHYARKEHAQVLVLTAPIETITQRLATRGNEDKRILQSIELIDDAFKFYAKEFKVPIIDTSKMTLQQIFNLIEDMQIA